MPRKSAASDLVRRSADDIPPAPPEHLAELLTAMDGPIDTSDIPETRGPTRRVRRDAAGRVVRTAPSPIRDAILGALKRREMTRYQLWAEARRYCPTISQSAVYEYLRGQRASSSVYLDAMFRAVGITLDPPPARPRKPGKSPAKVNAV